MKSTVKKRGWIIACVIVAALAALLYWRSAATDAPSGSAPHGRAGMRAGGAPAPVQAAT
ncbi:multidrug transporter subunit MdtA, partial [Cronobacter dublinensis]|nr:multidrug transporter subunit MdtA [Cronobacter dublinensis]